MKRFICWLTITIVLLAAFPAMADNTGTSGAYTYDIKGNGTITITKFDWEAHGLENDVYIPNMIDGFSVTGIGAESFAREEFSSKHGIEIHLPDSIVQIGEFAFKSTPISFINIPASVQLIGYGAFANCQDLLQFNVDVNNTIYATIDGVLFHKTQKQLFAYPFSKQGKYQIPEGILSIAPYAFYWEHANNENSELEVSDYWKKYDLRGLEWPLSLKEIGDYAFYGCMVSDVPHIDKIGNGSFRLAALWAAIGNEIPRLTIAENGEESFAGFAIAGKTYISLYAKEVAANSFRNSHQDFTLYDLEIIGEGAFKSCRSIQGNFPTTVKVISAHAFDGTAIDIPTIEISSQVTEIGDYAFANNGKSKDDTLQKIIIQNGCIRIGDHTFEGHAMLKEVVIPSSVTTIGEKAFSNCHSLKEIELPGSITTIGNEAFDKETITLIVEQGSYAALWASENGYAQKIKGQSDMPDWLNN